MATNGESAARWLAEQGDKTAPERLQQIRDNLANKLEQLDEDSEEYCGILEALDVMDNFIAGESATAPAPSESIQLDTTPLVDNSPVTQTISADERRAKFAKLMSEGRLPPEID